MRRRLAVLTVGASACALMLACSGAALAEDVPDCEFPAQSVELQRPVSITNTVPQTGDVETDSCGNVVGYTQHMDKIMTRGPWVPEPWEPEPDSPDLLDDSPADSPGLDGTIVGPDERNVRLPNSTGLGGFSEVPLTGPGLVTEPLAE